MPLAEALTVLGSNSSSCGSTCSIYGDGGDSRMMVEVVIRVVPYV